MSDNFSMRGLETSEESLSDSEESNYGQIIENGHGRIVNKLIPWDMLDLGSFSKPSGGDS